MNVGFPKILNFHLMIYSLKSPSLSLQVNPAISGPKPFSYTQPAAPVASPPQKSPSSYPPAQPVAAPTWAPSGVVSPPKPAPAAVAQNVQGVY